MGAKLFAFNLRVAVYPLSMAVLLRLPIYREEPTPSSQETKAQVSEPESTEPLQVQRPKKRSDCLPGGINAQRPCPFVTCKHHLFRFVSGFDTEDDLEKLRETCVLDVADRGGATLEETGEILNLTRERIRQVEVAVLRKLRNRPSITRLIDG